MLLQKLMGKGPTSMISPSAPKGLWSLGSHQNGQLGLGDYVSRSSPVQVGASITWASVSAAGSNVSHATKTDGTLWGWGGNSVGQLGLGDTANRSSPVQVGTLATWGIVESGTNTSFAIKTNGTLWAWGKDGYGYLGLGTSALDKSSPVQVGTLATWSQVSSSGNFFSAIKTDGTLWSWGRNASGRLGLGDQGAVYNARSSPTQIGTLTTWSRVTLGGAHSVAVKTDGTLWSWGYNSTGQLGFGDTIRRSSPVQVGTLATWSAVGAGESYRTFAIKTDGTLWAWGDNASNNYGTLGLGDIVNRSSPVQVGTLATWSLLGVASGAAFSVKIDRTLWGWGSNNNGRLGLGDVVFRSSPVQVGTLASWIKIEGGNNQSLGIHV